MVKGRIDVSEAGFDFLRTELETGFTLAEIARNAERADKAQRNRLNSRRAYDTVNKTREKLPLTAAQARELTEKLRRLRSQLEKLGEKFDQR